MIIYPAIDLLNGKCVRLFQGDYGKATQVSQDAIETAKSFLESGSKYLHVVDLNSAKDGGKYNFETIKELCKIGLKVQTGGGIRSLERIEECFYNGVERVIIGSKAVTDKDFLKSVVKLYGDRIIAGIDAKDALVMTAGWLEGSGVNYIDLAKEMQNIGVKTIIYTDISRDGTMQGADKEGTAKLIESVSIDIIASGGVNSTADLIKLKNIGASGAICGKSLYEGKIKLKELNLQNGQI